MGFYIETPEKINKADQLVDLYQAVKLGDNPIIHKAVLNNHLLSLICVIKNQEFDAARVVPDDEDYAYVTMDRPDDDRSREFLSMEREVVKKLCPYAYATTEV